MIQSDDLFLSDSANNRVLEYFKPAQAGSSPGTPGSSGDTTADEVFGENRSFTTTNFQTTNGESASTLLTPGGIALDGSGDLFIADEGNQRVLEYASTALDPPGAASLVLGRCDSFAATGCPTPPNIQAGLEETLNFALLPAGGSNLDGGLAFDAAANLYVADPANNRVLALTSPLTSSIPQFSGRVLGQANFAHNGVNLIDGTGYSTPWGIALDKSVTPNRLYVVDSQNSRVLAYVNVDRHRLSGARQRCFRPARFRLVLSKSIRQHASNDPTASTLAYPTAAVVDSSGNLYRRRHRQQPRAGVPESTWPRAGRWIPRQSRHRPKRQLHHRPEWSLHFRRMPHDAERCHAMRPQRPCARRRRATSTSSTPDTIAYSSSAVPPRVRRWSKYSASPTRPLSMPARRPTRPRYARPTAASRSTRRGKCTSTAPAPALESGSTILPPPKAVPTW